MPSQLAITIVVSLTNRRVAHSFREGSTTISGDAEVLPTFFTTESFLNHHLLSKAQGGIAVMDLFRDSVKRRFETLFEEQSSDVSLTEFIAWDVLPALSSISTISSFHEPES